jgi:hypothetical protein
MNCLILDDLGVNRPPFFFWAKNDICFHVYVMFNLFSWLWILWFAELRFFKSGRSLDSFRGQMTYIEDLRFRGQLHCGHPMRLTWPEKVRLHADALAWSPEYGWKWTLEIQAYDLTWSRHIQKICLSAPQNHPTSTSCKKVVTWSLRNSLLGSEKSFPSTKIEDRWPTDVTVSAIRTPPAERLRCWGMAILTYFDRVAPAIFNPSL